MGLRQLQYVYVAAVPVNPVGTKGKSLSEGFPYAAPPRPLPRSHRTHSRPLPQQAALCEIMCSLFTGSMARLYARSDCFYSFCKYVLHVSATVPSFPLRIQTNKPWPGS